METLCSCRFRVGTSGIYVGAKDLSVSDMTGGFSFSVESAPQGTEQRAAIRIYMGGREQRPTPLNVNGTDR